MQRLFWCGVIGAAAAGAGAQSYSIEPFTVDGGGGELVGTTHTLSGTIGQPDAADALVGSTYELAGGFWVATPFAPACPGDADGDGFVNFNDLNLVLGAWGGAGPDGDVDQNGIVNFDDLNLVLGNWNIDC